jgi:hypothetical protein
VDVVMRTWHGVCRASPIAFLRLWCILQCKAPAASSESNRLTVWPYLVGCSGIERSGTERMGPRITDSREQTL